MSSDVFVLDPRRLFIVSSLYRAGGEVDYRALVWEGVTWLTYP